MNGRVRRRCRLVLAGAPPALLGAVVALILGTQQVAASSAGLSPPATVAPTATSLAAAGAGAKSALLDSLGVLLSDSTRRAGLVTMLGGISYGVPSSPAFELLPNRPEEVTPLLTPHDFQSAISTWFDGNRLRVGLAVDSRPFVQTVGDIRDYQKDGWRQVLFRTVVGLGTSAATEGSQDVIGAVGVRTVLVDRGDPRTDLEFQDQLAKAIVARLTEAGQPKLGAKAADVKQRLAGPSGSPLKGLRDKYVASHWNATRVALGFAASARVSGGALKRDSLQRDQAGVWSSASTGIGRVAQLTGVGKAVWSRADSVSQETARQVLGARLLVFTGESVSLSAEVAGTWTRHKHAASLDEYWNHYAVVLEWYVPELKGWLGVGYGGDTSHRDRQGDGIELRYAFYRDPVLKR